MVLRSAALLCMVVMLILSAVCPTCGADGHSDRDISDNPPFSLAATCGDKMYYLPAYEGAPACDSLRQLAAVLSGTSVEGECVSPEITDVIFPEVSVTELSHVESISPRAP